jgi:hypothetical protein
MTAQTASASPAVPHPSPSPLGRAVLALLACLAGQQPADVGLDGGQARIDLPALLHGQGDAAWRLSDTALVKLFRLLRLARRLLDLEAGAADLERERGGRMSAPHPLNQAVIAQASMTCAMGNCAAAS